MTIGSNRPDVLTDSNVVGHDDTVDRARKLLRIHSLANLSATLLYLMGGVAVSVITWFMSYVDWHLYALTSLCTAIVVTNYGRLEPHVGYVRRASNWLFAMLIVIAWSALLYERSLDGAAVIDGRLLMRGPQPLFYIPVVMNLLCAALLSFHLLVVTPKAKRQSKASAARRAETSD